MLQVKTNILIVGAGTGGTALIQLFSRSANVNILGVADINPEAKGIKLAQELNMATSRDYKEFLNIKKLDEIINVTGSETVQEELLKAKPASVEVVGGHSAKLMWNLIEERLNSEEALKNAYIKLKETQQELIQSEKLSALGRFSSGIAHEVKNPLGIMLGGIEYLENQLLHPAENIKIALDKVKEAILRADNVLLGLLKFSKPSELKIERVSSRDLISEALSFYKYRASLSNVNITTEFSERDIYIDVDKNQIEQVIFNLLINSIDALPKGGNIKIKVYEKLITKISPEHPCCIIEVEDTGIGISKESLLRIFEPFFTTKSNKKGIGLGLSVAKTILENHKGDLQIESELGKGTVVRVILPESRERKAR